MLLQVTWESFREVMFTFTFMLMFVFMLILMLMLIAHAPWNTNVFVSLIHTLL